jgi:hypothetical protein
MGNNDRTRVEKSNVVMGGVTNEMSTGLNQYLRRGSFPPRDKIDLRLPANERERSLRPRAPVNDPKPGTMTKNIHSTPPLSKAVGSTINDSSKQPKRGVPGFMSPTAAVVAKSRPSVSKPGATAASGTKPHIRR